MVLIRDSLDEEDVENQHSFEYGEEHLAGILNSEEGGIEQRNVRMGIKTSFQNVGCFPLPHPGSIATKSKFGGTNGGGKVL